MYLILYCKSNTLIPVKHSEIIATMGQNCKITLTKTKTLYIKKLYKKQTDELKKTKQWDTGLTGVSIPSNETHTEKCKIRTCWQSSIIRTGTPVDTHFHICEMCSLIVGTNICGRSLLA